MKKTIKLLIVFVFLISRTTLSSDIPWYESFLVYKPAVVAVDTFFTIKSHILFASLLLSSNKHNNAIQTQLDYQERQIRIDELNSIKAWYDEFDMSDEQFVDTVSLTRQIKSCMGSYLSHPHGKTEQDPAFPKGIFPILKRNGIHPDTINLINSPTPDQNNIATTAPIICEYFWTNGQLYNITIENKPTITLNPLFWQMSNVYQIATLIHEAEHIKELHPDTRSILKDMIVTYKKIKLAETTTSRFSQVIINQERQAEVLPSLRNPYYASIMRKCRSVGYYKKTLFIKHYAQLSSIDELHKVHAKLHYYQTMPYETLAHARNVSLSMKTDYVKIDQSITRSYKTHNIY